MMKKFITTLSVLMSISFVSAQVGVNTQAPQGIFHVDGGGDNPSSAAPSVSEQANDVVFTSTGSIGVGTTTPNSDAAIDIASTNRGIRIAPVTLKALNDSSPLSKHVEGMIVYNNATSGSYPNNVVPGIYINNGTVWIQMSTSADFVPVGSVFHRATQNVPTGYLECNGAEVSRTTYAALFNVIGTTYGAGNGNTTFNLPELRGEFIRGWDHARGIDVNASGISRALGSFQTGSLTGGGSAPNPDLITLWNNSADNFRTSAFKFGWDYVLPSTYNTYWGTSAVFTNNTDPSTLPSRTTINPASSSNPAQPDYIFGMSRSRNVALLPIIKY